MHEEIVEMIEHKYAQVWDPYKTRCIWVANPDFIPTLIAMALPTKNRGGPVFISHASGNPEFKIFGRRVIFEDTVDEIETYVPAEDK